MKRKILFIEDDESLQEIALDMIDNQDEVDCVDHGLRACELLNQKNYDLVISDFRINGPSGLEVLKHIADSGAYPSVKEVIFCSSLLPSDAVVNDLKSRFKSIGVKFSAFEEKTQAYNKLIKKTA